MWLFRSSAVLLLYIGINIYTGIRVFALVRYFLPSLKAFFFWLPYILFCYSFLLVNLLRLDKVQVLRSISMFSLPAIAYFFMGFLVFDALRLVLRLLKHPSTRGFSAVGTGIILGLTVIILIYGYFNAKSIHTVSYDINLTGAKPGFRAQIIGLKAVLVSDLHIGQTVNRNWLAKVVNAANDAKPDLICIAGDIFDNNINTLDDAEGIKEELRRLKAPLGIYACQGNHDVDRFSLSEIPAADHIRDFLEKAGIILLQDEVVLIKDSFYLAGRRDARPIGARQERKSAAGLLEGLDRSKPVILLDHQPVDFPAEDEAGADLIFSGHTHKGQFFPGNIATAQIFRAAGAINYGHWTGRSAQAIISSGAGVWGPPFRIGTHSEVVIVNIFF